MGISGNGEPVCHQTTLVECKLRYAVIEAVALQYLTLYDVPCSVVTWGARVCPMVVGQSGRSYQDCAPLQAGKS